jgi:outer membrane lipoprotein-sorting protein
MIQRLIRRCILMAIICIVLPFRAGADSGHNDELDTLFLDIQKKSNQFQSLACKFTQERHLSLFNQPVLFSGYLAIIRPDHLRWEFTDPVPSVLIFSGNTGLRCTGKTPPVHFDLTSDPIMRMVAEQLWTWLNGNYKKLEDTYAVSLHAPSSLLIIPKDQGVATFIQSIVITFSTDSRQPEIVEITEPGGDKTIIHFHDFIFNAQLPASTFTECGLHE